MDTTSANTARPTPAIKRIPNPEEPRPRLAWPTVGVLVGGVGAWVGSTALALSDAWPWPLSVLVNTLAAFALFTVTHDACHRSISSSEAVNVWLGRSALIFMSPLSGLAMFRFIHMQHHRFTNDRELDPDMWASADLGRRWTLPLRWLTIDVTYLPYYARRLRTRPRREKVELASMWLLTATVIAAAIVSDRVLDPLLLWLLPSRLAIALLGWSFDYLPHHGLHAKQAEDPFQATRNRIGLERLLSPLLLYQNYHLVHHLHPVIPFYRYIAVWRRREEEYLENDPALSDVRGRELTADEYRRIRELAHH
jgi:ring-1,2-phenylacetyl-CoA epoxidase subunit PaaE